LFVVFLVALATLFVILGADLFRLPLPPSLPSALAATSVEDVADVVNRGIAASTECLLGARSISSAEGFRATPLELFRPHTFLASRKFPHEQSRRRVETAGEPDDNKYINLPGLLK
jgi:hypothetical protein